MAVGQFQIIGGRDGERAWDGDRGVRGENDSRLIDQEKVGLGEVDVDCSIDDRRAAAGDSGENVEHAAGAGEGGRFAGGQAELGEAEKEVAADGESEAGVDGVISPAFMGCLVCPRVLSRTTSAGGSSAGWRAGVVAGDAVAGLAGLAEAGGAVAVWSDEATADEEAGRASAVATGGRATGGCAVVAGGGIGAFSRVTEGSFAEVKFPGRGAVRKDVVPPWERSGAWPGMAGAKPAFAPVGKSGPPAPLAGRKPKALTGAQLKVSLPPTLAVSFPVESG